MRSGGAEFRLNVREKRHKGAAQSVIRDFDLIAAAGEFVALCGPSGCGKSTLLSIAAGLDHDFTGSVTGGGGRLGVVFQNPRLLPWRSLIDNILLCDPPGGHDAALALLTAMGLDGLENQFPQKLSVGQQRRAALARAFAVEPDLLLMDEPFVSLDEANGKACRALLKDQLAARPATVLFVTHDLAEARMLADRVVFLETGGCAIVAEERSPAAPSLAIRPQPVSS